MTRLEIRSHLEKNGSLFSEEGECGKDRLPCGLCDECIEEGVLDPFIKISRQPVWALRNMVLALEMCPWLNTTEEDERLSAAKVLLEIYPGPVVDT